MSTLSNLDQFALAFCLLVDLISTPDVVVATHLRCVFASVLALFRTPTSTHEQSTAASQMYMSFGLHGRTDDAVVRILCGYNK